MVWVLVALVCFLESGKAEDLCALLALKCHDFPFLVGEVDASTTEAGGVDIVVLHLFGDTRTHAGTYTYAPQAEVTPESSMCKAQPYQTYRYIV